jgi:hypothetical protein
MSGGCEPDNEEEDNLTMGQTNIHLPPQPPVTQEHRIKAEVAPDIEALAAHGIENYQ